MTDLVKEFERYADWAADVSPLYGRLASAAASDRRLLDIASDARPGQPTPQLLLAAVHAILLEGAEHPLGAFYPSCDTNADDPCAGDFDDEPSADDSDDDPVPQFLDFCLSNERRLRELVASRRVQTNDVGRSAVLLPAFESVARTADTRRLALVEIGASAGLNLSWDRYAYSFGDVGCVGDSSARVRIEPEIRGDRRPPLPAELPSVVSRRGVDLNPLDATDPDDARWLRALVHPDQGPRHERLAAALDVARRSRPSVVEGDVLEELPRLISTAPDDAELVVFSTHVLYQLDDETVAAIRSLLADYGSDRPIHWLSIDPSEELGAPVYRRVSFTDDGVCESQLARFESYGEWIEWTAD